MTSQTETSQTETQTDFAAIPGQDIIGAGYNPFVSYASPVNIVSRVFDWKSAPKDVFLYKDKTYSLPTAVDANAVSSSSYTNVTAQDIQSYQKNLAQSVKIEGSYNFFSGSLEEEFTSNSLTNNESAFSRIQQNIYTWSLQLTLDSNIRTLLKESFRTELDNLDVSNQSVCKDFFQRYGSHIVTGALFGGRAVRTSSTNKYTVDRKYSLSVASTQSFKFASGQADADEKAKYGEAVNSFNEHSDTTEKVEGGQVDKGAQVFSDNPNFAAWEGTVIDNPIFIGFTTNNPLSPIWSLCAKDEAGKRISSGLEAYFKDTWAPQESNALTKLPNYIDGLTVVTGGSSEIGPTQGYEKLNYDLNATVKGDYIYLCYHKQAASPYGGNKKAVTDITVIYGQNASPPPGYTKIEVDLNKGASGEYIYACYKLEDYSSNTAILSVTAFGGNSTNLPPPYGYTKVDKDLNAGAGGDFIFFAYAKQD